MTGATTGATTGAAKAPPDASLVPWPRLDDVLDQVILDLERDLWNREFQDLQEEELDALEERNPDEATRPITPAHAVLESVPRLENLLTQALTSFEMPGFVHNAIEHGFDGAVGQVSQGLTPEETTAMESLARKAIREGPESIPQQDPRTDPGYILWEVTTGDVIQEYGAATEEPGPDGRMPKWNEIPQEERVRIIGACQSALSQDASCDLLTVVAENLDWDLAVPARETAPA